MLEKREVNVLCPPSTPLDPVGVKETAGVAVRVGPPPPFPPPLGDTLGEREDEVGCVWVAARGVPVGALGEEDGEGVVRGGESVGVEDAECVAAKRGDKVGIGGVGVIDLEPWDDPDGHVVGGAEKVTRGERVETIRGEGEGKEVNVPATIPTPVREDSGEEVAPSKGEEVECKGRDGEGKELELPPIF